MIDVLFAHPPPIPATAPTILTGYTTGTGDREPAAPWCAWCDGALPHHRAIAPLHHRFPFFSSLISLSLS